MSIALACDHTAIEMKRALMAFLDERGVDYQDFGTNDSVRADYPVFGRAAAEAVVSGKCDRGIIICGSGIGISIVANKVKGVRCVVCSEPYSAAMSRRHNDTNMLAFGARVVGVDMAMMIVAAWLDSSYEAGRHQRRVNQIKATENGLCIEDQVEPGVL